MKYFMNLQFSTICFVWIMYVGLLRGISAKWPPVYFMGTLSPFRDDDIWKYNKWSTEYFRLCRTHVTVLLYYTCLHEHEYRKYIIKFLPFIIVVASCHKLCTDISLPSCQYPMTWTNELGVLFYPSAFSPWSETQKNSNRAQ